MHKNIFYFSSIIFIQIFSAKYEWGGGGIYFELTGTLTQSVSSLPKS